MITKELLNWISLQDKKLLSKFGQGKTKLERTYAKTIKLNEEVGELCVEVLASDGDISDEKLKHKDKDNLKYELADVVICTLLLASDMNVDINEALKTKIEKIDKVFIDVKII